MFFSPPVQLSDEDKLAVLRRLDQFRPWQSLDDERICWRCGRQMTGREIIVIGGSRGCGPLRIICPTRMCNSVPIDWLTPGPIETKTSEHFEQPELNQDRAAAA
jgi:hypothetical protein